MAKPAIKRDFYLKTLFLLTIRNTFNALMGIKSSDYCSQCPQKDGCKEVYQRLGQSDAPPVTGKVFWAFVAPIGLFTGLLVGFDRWLPRAWADPLRVLAVFGFSAVFTVAAVWLGKVLRNRRTKTAPRRPRRRDWPSH